MKLGQKAKDKITGFTGILTGHAEYISGCSQWLIVPPAKDGDFKDGHWFDEQRIEIDIDAPIVTLENGRTPGCDISAPKR